MSEQIGRLNELLQQLPWLATVLAVVCLLMASWLSNVVSKKVLVRGLLSLLRVPDNQQTTADGPAGFQRFGFIARLANIIPALVMIVGIRFVPGLPETVTTVTLNIASALIVLSLALAFANLLDMANEVYQRRPDAAARPIKGYLQVLKIVVYSVAVLLMIAAMLDRSPLLLLSGLGALAAVLMLIFQDTILSLVASVQIASNDIVRLGDWVEIPQLNADGEVVDIALHTVKIQNWDRTITTVPTKRFMSESFKNWRGMQESGGRRIKRAIYLDQTSVRFLGADEIRHLSELYLLSDYLVSKQQEIGLWNTRLAERGQQAANTRRITNLGTFRAYVESYLRHHSRVRQDMTLIVRHMNPTPQGLPLEVYCFVDIVEWAPFEAIQSDIFDHLLSILPEFDLRIFQQPSGTDMQHWSGGVSAGNSTQQESTQ
jgi:miniconductance mechanosensitive channel